MNSQGSKRVSEMTRGSAKEKFMSLSMVVNAVLPRCSGSYLYFLEGKMLSRPGEWGWGTVQDKKEELS